MTSHGLAPQTMPPWRRFVEIHEKIYSIEVSPKTSHQLRDEHDQQTCMKYIYIYISVIFERTTAGFQPILSQPSGVQQCRRPAIGPVSVPKSHGGCDGKTPETIWVFSWAFMPQRYSYGMLWPFISYKYL